MKKQHGYTLVELMLSMAVLVIISLLGYVVLSSSLEASRVADTQVQLQGNLRNVMQQLSGELRTAYSERSIAPKNSGEKAVTSLSTTPTTIPLSTQAISIAAGGRSITFQTPVPSTATAVPQPSTAVTIALQCEDAGFATGNGVLDSGEDANTDGMLTRRLNRTQDGVTKPMGAVNDIADVTFTLVASSDSSDLNKTTLKVRLVASKVMGIKKRLVQADLEGIIHLEN